MTRSGGEMTGRNGLCLQLFQGWPRGPLVKIRWRHSFRVLLWMGLMLKAFLVGRRLLENSVASFSKLEGVTTEAVTILVLNVRQWFKWPHMKLILLREKKKTKYSLLKREVLDDDAGYLEFPWRFTGRWIWCFERRTLNTQTLGKNLKKPKKLKKKQKTQKN